MCIALLSTAHPNYPLIILDNRDEFLNRATAPADWWEPPHQHVLGGRDLQRAEHGTWLGITQQGRFAVLTNFREEGVEVDRAKSRGGIATAWLTSDLTETPEEFVQRLIRDTGIHDVGGFSLWVGQLDRPGGDGTMNYPGVSIVSNRTSSHDSLTKIATQPGETHGLSNSHFGDRSWPKVVQGEGLLTQVIKTHIADNLNEQSLIDSLFELLTTDTLPKPKHDEPWQLYARQLRKSIFIPPTGEQRAVNGDSKKHDAADVQSLHPGVYGTQQQTVILVDKHGTAKFVQRTLYDSHGALLSPATRDQIFEFRIV